MDDARPADAADARQARLPQWASSALTRGVVGIAWRRMHTSPANLFSTTRSSSSNRMSRSIARGRGSAGSVLNIDDKSLACFDLYGKALLSLAIRQRPAAFDQRLHAAARERSARHIAKARSSRSPAVLSSTVTRWRPASLMVFLASPAQAYAPLWLKVLVIVMGLLIICGLRGHCGRDRPPDVRPTPDGSPAPASGAFPRAHRPAVRGAGDDDGRRRPPGGPCRNARAALRPPTSSTRAMAPAAGTVDFRRAWPARDDRPSVDHDRRPRPCPVVLRRGAGALGYPRSTGANARSAMATATHDAPAYISVHLQRQRGAGQSPLVLSRAPVRRRPRVPSTGPRPWRQRRPAGHPRNTTARLLRRLHPDGNRLSRADQRERE